MNLKKYIASLLFAYFLLIFNPVAFSQITYPGNPPGKAKAFHSANIISLENKVIKMDFKIQGTQIHPVSFTDKINNNTLNLISLKWFELTLKNGDVVADNDFQLLKKALIRSVK